jgi:ATP-dependent helicase/nuclease subunit A
MTEVVFTPAQRAAIEVADAPRDTCVVAGPGSGKTTVLVEHFRQLVETGANPQRILAITFTEKAAANMRAKLAEACPEIRAQLERAWVSTVHGFCARLLKENAVFAAVDPEFSVADPSDSWRLQQECIAAAIEELFDEQPSAVRALDSRPFRIRLRRGVAFGLRRHALSRQACGRPGWLCRTGCNRDGRFRRYRRGLGG